MKDALLALNLIKQQGVISDYAIGGAIAASFYIEAINTEDIDVFLFLSPSQDSILLSLTPIYDALKKMGGVIDKEYVVLGGWPVQILPAYKPLVEEAIRNAKPVKYGDIDTKVFSPEYLCAIALDTGRTKDYYRVATFIEQNEVDRQALDKLIAKYQLSEKTKNVLNWNSDETK